ncbi:MAG TPA: PRC-barrel domain-containing protein [Ktedonobacteraceae bacterium]|nr:PRC-barrel domain-containing protein [Ktedonobacteraceae bacterium]
MVIRNWFDLRGLPVVISREGRSAGTVEDFYYKLEINSIYALRVKVGVLGYRALSASAISTIESDAVTIDSDSMLIEEANGGHLTELPMSGSLLSSVVKSEGGDVLGKVNAILLATDPPVALRIAAFRLDNGKTFPANEVTDYDGNVMYILNKTANRL